MSCVQLPTTAEQASKSRSARTQKKTGSAVPQEGWEVVLLVDKKELAMACKQKRESFLDTLRESIRCELRSLPVGDYMWVARSGDFEIILDWSVERKTTVNLAISLMKKAKKHPPLNQMQVQLLNMKFSGILNKVLLVEKTYCWRKHHYRISSCFLKDLRREQPDVIVQHTPNLEATIDFLIAKHHDIDAQTLVEGRLRETPERPYLTFEQLRRNLREGFNRDDFRWEMDLRQNRCLGPKKAKAVMTVFPTRSSLREAFQCDREGTIQRLADLKSFSTKTSKEVCGAFASPGCGSDTESDSNLDGAPDVEAESEVMAALAGAATHQTLQAKPPMIELLDSTDESEDGKLPVISPESWSNRGFASRKRKLHVGRNLSTLPGINAASKQEANSSASMAIEILSDSSDD